MAKIRLNWTESTDDTRFLQSWTITDDTGTDIHVITDSEWGDIDVRKNGDHPVTMDGVTTIAARIAELAIMYGWLTEAGTETEVCSDELEDITG